MTLAACLREVANNDASHVLRDPREINQYSQDRAIQASKPKCTLDHNSIARLTLLGDVHKQPEAL